MMTTTQLTTVSRTSGANVALKDGDVSPAHFELNFLEVPVLVEAFTRMVRSLEFDVCEMAFTTYLTAKAAGRPFTALPVFLVRGLHHGAIVYNVNSGISTPRDLEGRVVGVGRGYTVTTGVWARGILAEQYGVHLDSVTWMRSADEHVLGTHLPSNVKMIQPGQSLADMLINGEIDAAVNVEVDHPNVRQLVPDASEKGYQTLVEKGLYPINHLVVVKDELLAKYPDLARDVFEAFTRAKYLYVGRLRAGKIADPTPIDRLHLRVMELTGQDPLPYGIERNRQTIEHLVSMAVHQKILTRAPKIDELFAKETWNLPG